MRDSILAQVIRLAIDIDEAKKMEDLKSIFASYSEKQLRETLAAHRLLLERPAPPRGPGAAGARAAREASENVCQKIEEVLKERAR